MAEPPAPLDAATLAALLDGATDAEVNRQVAETGVDPLLERVFVTMCTALQPEATAGAAAVVQWDLATPAGPRHWQLKVAEGRASAAAGATEAPRVSLGLDVADLLRFVAGRLDGMDAFLAGRLRVSGDLMVAQAMQSWFLPPS